MSLQTDATHLTDGATLIREPRPRMLAVGTALPESRYTQEEVSSLLSVPDGIGTRFFKSSGIETRHLWFEGHQSELPSESQSELLTRHRKGALSLGRRAIGRCLDEVSLGTGDVDFLCCVTSTGFMMPGLSAMYIRHLGFSPKCQRVDIVGMGCHAALNALNVTSSWCSANPRRLGLVVCCEINSAIHVNDSKPVTYLVNSLFGDGCAAMLVASDIPKDKCPEIVGFASEIVPDAWRAISYAWSSLHNKFELYLDRDIPKVLGLHSPSPVNALLRAAGLEREAVSHWLIHAGGKKVITAVGDANGMTEWDVRHARNVLRKFGNLGSPTVMFSYQDLLQENVIRPGATGLMVTMGPGATIETALLSWSPVSKQ